MRSTTAIFTGFLILFFVWACSTVEREVPKGNPVPNPSGENLPILDENGEEVQIYSSDPEFFQNPSTDPMEYFRVRITSDSYEVRQIRGTDKIIRVSDLGGDQLIQEEVGRYDKIDFKDDGALLAILNGETGTMETLRFERRVPRINNVATIMQNDMTRWSFQMAEEEMPNQKFVVTYEVILQNKAKANRDSIKNELRKNHH